MRRKTIRQCIWGWSWLIFSKIFSILRNTLPWHSKKIVHLLFCLFWTKLNKAVNIFCRLPEWIRNVQMIPGFSTRFGWERGWKSCMNNSKDWRPENVNVIELNCKVVKKVATLPFLHHPPPSPPFLFRFIPCSSKEFCTPQVTQVWLQSRRKFLVWSQYYNHFGIPLRIMAK